MNPYHSSSGPAHIAAETVLTNGPSKQATAWMTSLFARWRKPVGRVIAIIFISALIVTDASPSPILGLTMEISGILLISVAVLGRIWCALYISGRKNAELCTDGPYSLSRNPLYVFSFLGAVGVTLVADSLLLGLALVPVFWGYHYFVIKSEEAHLHSLFGKAYADYCARVARIIPTTGAYWSRNRLIIDPRTMLRAFSEVSWFLVALAASEIIEHARNGSTGVL